MERDNGFTIKSREIGQGFDKRTLDAFENLMDFRGGITTSEYLTNLGTLDGELPKWDWSDWFQETRWFQYSIRMSVMLGSIAKY